MPTGSEKWPTAALGQENLQKNRSNRCVQVLGPGSAGVLPCGRWAQGVLGTAKLPTYLI